MNEMTVLAEFGERLDPPTAQPPADTRRRVMTATRTLPKRRLRLRLAGAGALAAVVTGAILAGQVVGIGDHPPASTAQAAEILRGAAARAHGTPAVPVRGDEFIYVDSIDTAASIDLSGDHPTTIESRQHRIWLSVDGTRDGLSRSRPKDGSAGWTSRPEPGCRDGFMNARKGDRTVRVPCTPAPNYRGDLPTDAGAMLAYLRAQGGTKNGPDQDAFTAAGDLIRGAYLAPAVLSAVFQAVGRIPGVTVAGDVTDEAGRHGIAVTRDEVQGLRTELIFDRRTYAYLGEREVEMTGQDGLRAGQVRYSVAVLRVAVVPAAGRLP
jgi:hypothetical protein